jgi:hypothetical protein
MSVLRVLAVVASVAAASAVAVPFAMPSLLFRIDVSGLGMASPAGHAGHAGHGDHAGHAGPAAAAHGHEEGEAGAAGHGSAQAHGDDTHDGEAEVHSGHAPTEAGDHAHDAQPGMQRPRFPPAVGRVPESPAGLRSIGTLRITGDSGFTADGSPFRGSGTLEDPYVLRGVYARTLSFLNTDACFEIAESWIDVQLVLDWNGQCVWAHHNHIWDLRVNQNNARTGYATGGLIEDNEITFVGQLRHFDGEFRDNVVGPVPEDAVFGPVFETVPYSFLKDTRVANVDGFNQGLIHHNRFFGSVDLDLHGHHHGTGFFAPHSHYHGDSSARMAEHVHDHTDRWTSVAFTDNTIVDAEGYGLRYEDQSHAGDDRTARSESTKELNEMHVHHTDIVLSRNTIEGGQLWVDVFNADDRNHKGRNPGTLTIEGNTIKTRELDPRDEPCVRAFGGLHDTRTTLHINTAKEVDLAVRGNVLTYVPLARGSGALDLAEEAVETCLLWRHQEPTAAIRVEGVRDSSLLFEGNVARGVQVGIHARELDSRTAWRVVGNDFTGEPILRESVANDPETG